MLSTASNFDLHAKRVFLTYSQCGETTKEELRDFLHLELGIPWYIIGYETHEDGGKHLHAYIEFTEQKRIRNQRYFDFHDVHPNIQGVRNPTRCQAYCIKDGDYIANMSVSKGKRTYGDIVASSSSATEFLVAIEESYTRDMVLYFDRINAYANHKWPAYENIYETEFSNFVVPEELVRWMEDNINGR